MIKMRSQVFLILFFGIILCTFDYINAIRKDKEDPNVDKLAKKNISKVTSKHHSSRFKGFSFLAGLLAVIFSGIFLYYFFICYPILCRRERNYDFVEHSRDITPTRNIEKTP